jgi:hypothetical protein
MGEDVVDSREVMHTRNMFYDTMPNFVALVISESTVVHATLESCKSLYVVLNSQGITSSKSF